MGSVPVQVPLVVLRTWPTRAVPVIAGSLLFLGATAGAADESAAQAAKSPPRAATAAATPTIAMYARWKCVVRLFTWSLPPGCLRRSGTRESRAERRIRGVLTECLLGLHARVSRPSGAGNHDVDSDGGEAHDGDLGMDRPRSRGRRGTAAGHCARPHPDAALAPERALRHGVPARRRRPG